MDNFAFEAQGLQDLAADLRKSALRLHEEANKVLPVIAEEVAKEARSKAAEHSKSIPSTIHARAIPGAAIVEAVGDSPLPALYELGNRGRGGRRKKTFRHPVFGQNVYVEQPRYPFLRPAMTSLSASIEQRLDEAAKRGLGPLHLK